MFEQISTTIGNVLSFRGILNLSVLQLVVITLVLTHITIASVTMFLHRSQAHKSVTFHPIVNHFFRLWLWLTTAMVTKEWVAVHRKHHAKCESEEDPHSPIKKGINHILWGGVYYYKKEAAKQETLEVYGKGTPSDWIEKNIYNKFNFYGIMITMAIDITLFGIPGLLVWAIQMYWIPFWAAGVINGIAHYYGYRNFSTKDTATNIFPIAFLIGGEELHNNHHAFPRSAKLSYRSWEFDIGWFYIKLLSYLHLAKINEVMPARPKTAIFNFDNFLVAVNGKLRTLTQYERKVMLPVFKQEQRISKGNAIASYIKTWFVRDESLLDNGIKKQIESILSKREKLKIVYTFKQKLQIVWHGVGISIQERVARLNTWCEEAEKSGINALNIFAQNLRKRIPVIK